MERLKSKGVNRSKRIIRYATASDLRRVFIQHRNQLHWLALFLAGEEGLADACLSHAWLLAVTRRQVCLDEIEHWARRGVILTAAKIQQNRITQLAAAYRPHPCRHQDHPSLTGPELTLLKAMSHDIVFRIDVLCRFALVMRGIENYSADESALLLEVGRETVDAAYCAALESFRLLDAEASATPGQMHDAATLALKKLARNEPAAPECANDPN